MIVNGIKKDLMTEKFAVMLIVAISFEYLSKLSMNTPQQMQPIQNYAMLTTKILISTKQKRSFPNAARRNGATMPLASKMDMQQVIISTQISTRLTPCLFSE